MTRSELILGRIHSLRPLSPGLHQVLAVVLRADYSLSEVTSIVERDPAVVAGVLRVVNSAAYGLGREITSVSQAISLLGEKMVLGIALAACGEEVFDAPLKGYASSRGDLGRHSLWTAICARELVRLASSSVDSGAAFTAGLLHDIGKVVISDFLVGSAAELLEELDTAKVQSFREAELLHLDIDHCRAGALLARHWNLPEPLLSAIEFHHEPERAEPEQRTLVCVVHLANALACCNGFGTGLDALANPLLPVVTEYLPVDPQLLDAVTIATQKEFAKTAPTMFSAPGVGP